VALAALDDQLVGFGLGDQGVDLIGRDVNRLGELGGTGAGVGFDSGQQLLAALAAGCAL